MRTAASLLVLVLLLTGCATAPAPDSAAEGNVTTSANVSAPLQFEQGWNESAPVQDNATAEASPGTAGPESEGESGTDGEAGADGADGEDCGDNSTTVNVGTGNCQ